MSPCDITRIRTRKIAIACVSNIKINVHSICDGYINAMRNLKINNKSMMARALGNYD